MEEMTNVDFTSIKTYDLDFEDRESLSDIRSMLSENLNIMRLNYPGLSFSFSFSF